MNYSMGGNIATIIVVAIIVAAAVALFMFKDQILGIFKSKPEEVPENFDSMTNPDIMVYINNAVENTAEEVDKYLVTLPTMSNNKNKEFIDMVFKPTVMSFVNDKNITSLDDFIDKIDSGFEAKARTFNPDSSIDLTEIKKIAVVKMGRYLTSLILPQNKMNESVNDSLDLSTLAQIATPAPITKNVIVDEIRQDYKELAKTPFPINTNTNALLSNINYRKGFLPHTKGNTMYDPRGLAKSQMRWLGQMSNSKDPNSLIRSHSTDPATILQTRRGFGNEDIYNQALDEFMIKTGNREFGAFKQISGMTVPYTAPKSLVDERNKMDNILQEIKQG